MKAILKIGSFTMMTDIPDRRPTWDIIAPSGKLKLSVESLAFEQIADAPMHKRWRFEYKDILWPDQGNPENSILLYEFAEEV